MSLPSGFGKTLRELRAQNYTLSAAMREAWRIHKGTNQRIKRKNPKRHAKQTKISESTYSIAVSRGYPYIGPGFEVIDGVVYNRFSKTSNRKPPHILVAGYGKVIEENNPYRKKIISGRTIRGSTIPVDLGQGLKLVYSLPNQGWVLYWGNELLGVFNDKESALEKAKELKGQNPGAAWHRKQQEFFDRKSDGVPKGSKLQRYYQGHADAHYTSKATARAMGMNPKRKRKRSGKNPIAVYNPKTIHLPMRDIEIRYRRNAGEYKGKLFRHPFESNVTMHGLPNGDILIKGNGKRLYGSE